MIFYSIFKCVGPPKCMFPQPNCLFLIGDYYIHLHNVQSESEEIKLTAVQKNPTELKTVYIRTHWISRLCWCLTRATSCCARHSGAGAAAAAAGGTGTLRRCRTGTGLRWTATWSLEIKHQLRLSQDLTFFLLNLHTSRELYLLWGSLDNKMNSQPVFDTMLL